jgi:hypothetical protein
MLDAHPEIGCPAEVGIPGLIANLGRVWWTVDSDVLSDRGRDPLETEQASVDDGRADGEVAAGRPEHSRLPELPAEAMTAIRKAVLAPMLYYCQRDGKKVYCDKSLDSVHHLEAVRQVFPATRYLLLFRHVMDTVASGIEASPWGFHAYGYTPFVHRSPDNFVAALVNYWLAHVDAALRWEEAHPACCQRILYEDLVRSPQRVLDAAFAFLGVTGTDAVLKDAFVRAQSAKGPGDYKVTFTSAVDPRSLGRGKRVPVEMIPPPLLAAANEKLEALGYERLDRGWNAEPAPTNGWAHQLGSSAARLTQLLSKVDLSAVTERRPVDTVALVAQDYESLRWVVDFSERTIRQGDGEVECVITGIAEDLASLLSGEVNAGVLLRSGRVRYLSADDNINDGEAIEATRLVTDTLGHGRQAPDAAGR